MAAYKEPEVMEHSTAAHKCQSPEDQSKTNTKPMMDSVGQ